MSSFFQKIVKLFSYDIGIDLGTANTLVNVKDCLLYTSPSPRDTR